MKNAVFWDVTPCIYCVNRRFGGTYRLHLQGRKIHGRGTSVSRLQTAATCLRWFLSRRFFYPEDGGDTFLRNVGLHNIYTAPHPRRQSSGLHNFSILQLRLLLAFEHSSQQLCSQINSIYEVFRLCPQRFGSWICFRSQMKKGETPTELDPLDTPNLNHETSVELSSFWRTPLSRCV
jgi:hypothetical protein